MPEVNNTPQEKPWYKNSNNWAWVITGICILTAINIIFMDTIDVNIQKVSRHKPKSYKEVFTPEEQHKLGIDRKMDGSDIVNTDPNAAKNVREFIEKGGNADPAGDAIQDGDYHDLLDQNGGPEGF